MKYSNFEKQIARELRGAQEPVQMDSLLASLDLGQETKPERSGRWIMFAVAVASVLSMLLASIAYFYNGDGPFSSNITSSDSQSTVQDVRASEAQSLSINTTETIITNLTENHNQNSESSDSDESTGTNGKAVSLTNSQSDNSSINQSASTHAIDSETSTASSNLMISRIDGSLIGDSALRTNEEVLEANTISRNISRSSTFGTIEGVTTSSKSQYRTPANPTTKSAANIEEGKSIDGQRLALSVALLDMSREDVLVSSLSAERELFTRMKINCPSFNKAEYHLALIPEVGIFKPFKTIASKSSEVPVEFPKRSQEEKTLEGTTVGLHTMLVRDRVPLYFKAGLSYTRISEQMNLTYQYTELDTTIGIISSTVSGNGDTLTQVFGPIVNETTYTGKNRQHYYIHMINLPLSVGYTTYVAGFDLGIEGGVNINLLTQGTGNLLTSDRDYTNLSFNDLFKKRVGLSYFGGLMIGRNFGPFGDIYVAPRFHYYPSDFSSAANPISQNYLSVGINAGLVYTIK